MLRAAAICLTTCLGLTAGSALAQEGGGSILLHLYQIQDIPAAQTGTGPACRIYFMLQNETTDELQALDIDAYLFNDADEMQEHVRLGFSAVPAQKRRMFPFDIANVDCTMVKVVMINDILACTTAAEGPDRNCAANLEVDSRADIQIEDSAPRG